MRGADHDRAEGQAVQGRGCASASQQTLRALLRRGVVVHPGQFYELSGEAFLFVSLIVAPANFDAGIWRIGALVGEG